MRSVLTPLEIARIVLADPGWFAVPIGHQVTIVAIGLGESDKIQDGVYGVDTRAHNKSGDDDSYGWLQINYIAKYRAERVERYGPPKGQFDPAHCAATGYDLYFRRNKRFIDWGAFNDGGYRKYGRYERAEEAVRQAREEIMAHPYHSRSTPYSSAIPAHVAAFRRVMSQHFGYTRTEVVRDRARCPGSRHCVSEAIDLYTTDLRPEGIGRRLFNFCVRHGHTLDIQAVIFNRRVVGFGNWIERTYTGSHPHQDHVHMEFNDNAKTHVTEAKIRALLEGGTAPPPTDTGRLFMSLTAAEEKEILEKVRRTEALLGDVHGTIFIRQGKVYKAVDKINAMVPAEREAAISADEIVDEMGRRFERGRAEEE